MKNDIQYNLRMPRQLYDRLKEQAAKHETTVSDYIRSCCWTMLLKDIYKSGKTHAKTGEDLNV